MGWNSWQLTHQPSSSSINTHSGLPVQRLDLKDEKSQKLQSWSLSWTGWGNTLSGWGWGWDVGGLARRRAGEGSGLGERASTEEGCAVLLQLGSVGGMGWGHRGGASGMAVRCRSTPISTLHCTAQGSPWGPGGPCQFLVKSSCHLRPWPQDLGALWLSLPSAQSPAVPLRGFSPHFIRRVTQTRVHMI